MGTLEPNKRRVAFVARFESDHIGDRDSVVMRLKKLLKSLLRAWRFHCVAIEEVIDQPAERIRSEASRIAGDAALEVPPAKGTS